MATFVLLVFGEFDLSSRKIVFFNATLGNTVHIINIELRTGTPSAITGMSGVAGGRELAVGGPLLYLVWCCVCETNLETCA